MVIMRKKKKITGYKIVTLFKIGVFQFEFINGIDNMLNDFFGKGI